MKSVRIKTLVAVLAMGCMALSHSVMANPISLRQAQQNVLAFLQQRGNRIATPLLHQLPMTSTTSCYIFSIGDNEGYVIAAADDCISPILGYSDTGTIDVDNIPDNMQWWLDEYACQIQFMRDKGLSAPRLPRKSPQQPAIAPLLTTHWNQTPPYNQACPLDTNGQRCVTGCLATAMAQVLYYHHARSVTHTTHEMPAYVTDRGVSVDAVPAGSFIDWDNMVERYGRSVETTAEQDAAVANLMKYCGTSIQMNYTSGSSDALTLNVAPAMVAYFNYTSKTKAWNRSGCGLSDDEWEDLIYHELSNSRPVLYSGCGKSGVAHAFVCDGYDGEGFFHFNWGWGDNGTYYLLTAMDSVGTSLIHYDRMQEAIINAEPRLTGPLPVEGILFADPVTRALCLQSADTDDDGNVTIEEAASVTSMGPFRWASMSSFDEFKYFSGDTSLCSSMFYACRNMESITFPDSLRSIGNNAFENCSSLKEISIPSTVTSVGNYAFAGCDKMKRFFWNVKSTLPVLGGIVPVSVECLTIGDSVKEIPNNFAKNVRLNQLTIGKSVTRIGSYAFYQCTGLKRVVIPDSVKYIYQYAFYENTGLEEVILGDGLITIGDWTFGLCSGLKTISIPNSVTRIGTHAFDKCTGLKSVVIGKSAVSIYHYAFIGCDNLEMVTCLVPEPPIINVNVFKNLYEQAVLRVPAEAVEAYQGAYPWNQFSEIIAIDPSEGDVNLDGATRIDDVTCLINQILKGGDTDYSDVNGDGHVTIDDVTILIDMLLSSQKQ